MMAYGARATLVIGVSACLAATLLGVSIGAVSGFYGGWREQIANYITELFQTIPGLVLVLSVVAISGSTMHNIILAIALASWTPIARLTRAEFLSCAAGPSCSLAAPSAWVRCG